MVVREIHDLVVYLKRNDFSLVNCAFRFRGGRFLVQEDMDREGCDPLKVYCIVDINVVVRDFYLLNKHAGLPEPEIDLVVTVRQLNTINVGAQTMQVEKLCNW